MVIKTKLLVPKGYAAITIYPFIFTRRIDPKIINHEKIHLKQQIELLIVFFYLLYFLEYIYLMFKYSFDRDKAYRNISFEKEAYRNQSNYSYLNNRKTFNQWRQ